MENIDPKTKEVIDLLKQSLANAMDRLNNIDLQKAIDNHQKMEDIKQKIGVNNGSMD